jgi:cytochrome c556
MNRLFLLAGLCVAVVLASGAKADDTPMSIKEIMKVTHGKGGYKGKVEAAVKSKDFDTISNVAKDWEKAAMALASAKPSKGEAESWKKLTDNYTKAIKTMTKAAGDKDVKGVNASLKSVGGSCGGCHKSHK